MAKTLIVLSVDPEFRDLCPPLDQEEKELLRQSIISEDGCRDPIVYWDTDGNPILDGHNRHEICEGEGLKYPAKPLYFADRHEAELWILRNQLGRRNLTDAQRSIARGRLYNETKADPVENLKNGKKPANSPKGQNDTSGTSAARIAAADGVSEATVKRDGKLAEAVDTIKAKSPEVAKAIQAGEIPTGAAAKLAEAPKSELKKLEKLDGADLRKAAKATAEKQTAKAERTEPESIDDRMKESNRRLDALARQIMECHKAAVELAEPHLESYGRIQILESQLKTAAGTVKAAKGAGPCSYCEGDDKAQKKCKWCRGTGWLDLQQIESAPKK